MSARGGERDNLQEHAKRMWFCSTRANPMPLLWMSAQARWSPGPNLQKLKCRFRGVALTTFSRRIRGVVGMVEAHRALCLRRLRGGQQGRRQSATMGEARHEGLAWLPCQNFSFRRFPKQNAGELSFLVQLTGGAESVIDLPVFVRCERIERVVDFRLKGEAGWEREKKNGETENSRMRCHGRPPSS